MQDLTPHRALPGRRRRGPAQRRRIADRSRQAAGRRPRRESRVYSAALAPFGYKLVYDEEPSLGFGMGDGGDDDEPFALERAGSPIVRTHVAFTASSTEQVDEFHAAALAAGGRDNGAPGERPYGAYYYAAFVLDPDGHNIEAVYHRR